MAVGLWAFVPGQPDLEAGVTASTGLFYCAVGAGTDVGGGAGAAAGAGMALLVTNAGSIQLNRSCTL